MKLYEYDKAIEDALARLEPDAETGEVTVPVEEVLDEIQRLEIDKQEKIRSICALIVNANADIDAYKAQIAVFNALVERAKKKVAYLEAYLEANCSGESHDFGFAKFKCLPSSAGNISITDEDAVKKWISANGMGDELIKVTHTEKICEGKVKELIKAGAEIEGAEILHPMKVSVTQPKPKK